MSAARLDTGLSLLVAGLLLLIVFGFVRRSPRAAIVGWLLVVFFVPIWVGVTAYAYFPAFALATILAAFSLLPTPLAVRPHVLDLVFLAVLAAVVVQVALGLTTRSGAFDLIVVWSMAFLLGRLIAEVVDPVWVYGAFAVLGAAAGVLAVVEFLTGSNFFIDHLASSNGLFTTWGGLQPRGSVIRAEGAFGHSIALGITMGVSVCFALGSRFRPWVKTVLVGLAGAGAAVSFSRAAFLTVILAILLSAFFLREGFSRVYRVALVLLLGLGVIVALRPVLSVFASDDLAEGSALYRSDLLSLISGMRAFGLTNDYAVSTTREVSVGGFGSIDNAVLLFGLIYGWVPLVVLGLVALGAVVTVLRRRATTATIAVVAQLPALFTVAFITQYASVAWFSAGLALGSHAVLRVRRPTGRGARRAALPGSPLPVPPPPAPVAGARAARTTLVAPLDGRPEDAHA